MDERRGLILRVLGLVERVFDTAERAWTLLIVGGLFVGATFFYVLYLVRH